MKNTASKQSKKKKYKSQNSPSNFQKLTNTGVVEILMNLIMMVPFARLKQDYRNKLYFSLIFGEIKVNSVTTIDIFS